MSDVNLKKCCPYSNMYYFCFFSDWVHRLYQMVPHNMCWAALYLTGLLLQSLHFIKHTHTHKHTNSLFMFTCGPGCCHRTLKAKVLRFQRQLLYIFKEMYIYLCVYVHTHLYTHCYISFGMESNILTWQMVEWAPHWNQDSRKPTHLPAQTENSSVSTPLRAIELLTKHLYTNKDWLI